MIRISLATILLICTAQTSANRLAENLREFEPFLGTWEVDAQWQGGQKVWSRSQYAVGVGGNSVEGRVMVKDGDGAPYVRYLVVYTRAPDSGAWQASTIHRDGHTTTSGFSFGKGLLSMEWEEGTMSVRDRSQLLDASRLHWLVDVAPSGSTEFSTVMDTVWHKQGDSTLIQPIDTNLFTTDQDAASFVKETTIEAPVETVYAAWTDATAFPAAYDPDRPKLTARIDLAIGGRYEWLWDGELGSNGCQVLSFIPNRMISFSWNAPPEQADSRAKRTWVVVELEPTESGGTKLRLTHLGFGKAAHWAETRDYFSAAWPHVFAQFRSNLEADAEVARSK